MRLAPVLDGDDVGQPLRRGVQLTAVAATLSTHLMKNLEKLVPVSELCVCMCLYYISGCVLVGVALSLSSQ